VGGPVHKGTATGPKTTKTSINSGKIGFFAVTSNKAPLHLFLKTERKGSKGGPLLVYGCGFTKCIEDEPDTK